MIVVDDRPAEAAPTARRAGGAARRVRVLRGRGAGPAAARNAGWRAARAPWIVFLDDDVVPAAGLARAPRGATCAACRRTRREPGPASACPLPAERRPTDWERNVAGLERARWATADMAYRRAALEAVGGFDERFPRAYREDADLGLRVDRAPAGGSSRGGRRVVHPVGPARPWVSVRQAGRQRRRRADAPRCTAATGASARARRAAAGRATSRSAAAGASAPRRSPPRRRRAAAAARRRLWLAGHGRVRAGRASRRGRGRAREVATMLWTSAAMPLRGRARWWLRGAAPRAAAPAPRPARPPRCSSTATARSSPTSPTTATRSACEPMPGAREALDRLRARGRPARVVSNQSGIARGLLAPREVEAVNARMEELLGPFGPLG